MSPTLTCNSIFVSTLNALHYRLLILVKLLLVVSKHGMVCLDLWLGLNRQMFPPLIYLHTLSQWECCVLKYIFFLLPALSGCEILFWERERAFVSLLMFCIIRLTRYNKCQANPLLCHDISNHFKPLLAHHLINIHQAFRGNQMRSTV